MIFHSQELPKISPLPCGNQTWRGFPWENPSKNRGFRGKILEKTEVSHRILQVISLSPGAMPVISSSSAWYLCPLVVSWADAFGTDLVERTDAWWQMDLDPEIEDECENLNETMGIYNDI